MTPTPSAGFAALIAKLKTAPNWHAHLAEAIAFFSTEATFVVVESPYAAPAPAELERNLTYARAATHDALVRHGEIPLTSHIKYTQPGILDDTVAWERALGIAAGLAEGSRLAKFSIVYIDLGLSDGMKKGLLAAVAAGRPVILRSLMTYANPIHTLASAQKELSLLGIKAEICPSTDAT